MESIYREFTPDLELRSRASGGDGRTVDGIVVPWDVEMRINANLTEVFRPGAFDHQFNAVNRVKFSREHLKLGGTLIGRALAMSNDAKGLRMAFRISDTPAGNETLELLRDGALDELSVGFYERQNRTRANGTVERVTADLFEVSAVLTGAYGRHAVVEAVRSVEPATPNLDEVQRLLSSL